jgi:hypothetical protein
MFKQSDDTTICRLFESAADIFDTVKNLETGYTHPAKCELDWTGGKRYQTWAEAGIGHLTPDATHLKTIATITEAIREKMGDVTDIKRKASWSDQSGEIDVDRVMAGEPVCYRRTSRKRVTTATSVTIYLAMSASARTKDADINRRTAIAVAVADVLEDAGVQVEIIGTMHTTGCYNTGTPKNCENMIVMKEAGEELSVAKLSSMSTAWFLRVPIFASIYEGQEGNTSMGLGYPSSSISKCGQKMIDDRYPAQTHTIRITEFPRNNEGAIRTATELIQNFQNTDAITAD